MTGNTPDPALSPEAETIANIQAADDALSTRVEALRKVIADISPEVTKLQSEQRSTWNWLKSGAGFVAFDVLITIFGLIFGFHLHTLINQNQSLLQQVRQTQTRLNVSIHEACALYNTFDRFYSDAAKQRFVGGPAEYDTLYTQLQTSADNLQCGLKHVVPGT